jgi:hypothetical protein
MYDEMERIVLSCDLPERTEKLKFRVSHPMTCQCVFCNVVLLCVLLVFSAFSNMYCSDQLFSLMKNVRLRTRACLTVDHLEGDM